MLENSAVLCIAYNFFFISLQPNYNVMKRLAILLVLLFVVSHSYSENSDNLDTIFNRVAKLFKQEKYIECNDLAKCLYEKSIETTDTVLVFNSLYYMGFSNQRMGNMEEALDYNLKAYDVALLLDRLDLQSSIMNNIANVYMVNDEDSLAVIYFEKSIDIENQLIVIGGVMIGDNNWHLV